MYLSFHQIYTINIISSIVIIFLFYSGILVSFTGYLDWEYYSEVFNEGIVVNDGFINFLNYFKNIFGAMSIYVWHIIFTTININYLSKIQTYYFKIYGYKYFFVFVNPFVYILISSIGKESLIFALLFIFLSLKNNLLKNLKIISHLLIIYVRPHMFALILYEYIGIKYTYLIAILILFFAYYFELVNASFIYSSYVELDILGLKDLPVYLIQNYKDLILLPINLGIIIFSWKYSNSIVINIWGFVCVLSIIIFLLNKKLQTIEISNIIIFYLIGYSFIVSNSGTAMRVFSFAVYASLGYMYFNSKLLNKKTFGTEM